MTFSVPSMRTAPPSLSARFSQLARTNHGTWRGWVRSAICDAEFVAGRLQDWTCVRQPEAVQRLVFVCLGNINRSAFAHAVSTRNGARTASLGLSTTTGAPAYHTAVLTAKGMGVDLQAHRATDLSDHERLPGDLYLTMETRHLRDLLGRGYPRDSLALLGAWATPMRLHLHDPHTLDDAYFHSCFTLIHSATTHLTRELAARGSPAMQP
jgi:protein-tyrosine phosphatase